MKDDSPLVPQAPGMTVARFREATDVANVCKEIVMQTAVEISGRKYVRVEGWTSIAVAHGCIASIKPDSVVEVFRDGKFIGIKAVAQVKRQSDGVVLTEAEGFVGDDETTWFGSHGEKIKRWSLAKRQEIEVVIEKRADYAIRSMAQTRAVAKACRNAFSHVVVLMDKGLSTTPAEEMEGEVIEAETHAGKPGDKKETMPGDAPDARATEGAAQSGTSVKKEISVPRDEIVTLEKQFTEGRWRKVKVHFGTNRGTELGTLLEKNENGLLWYCFTWTGGAGFNGKPPSADDKILRAACNVAISEENFKEPAARS